MLSILANKTHSVEELTDIIEKYSEFVHAKDKYGYTSLHNHTTAGCYKQVKILLDAKADPNALDGEGWTAIFDPQNAKIAKLLLDYKADPNARLRDRRTPLHMEEDHDTCKVLLEAKADPNAVDDNKNSPLTSYDNIIRPRTVELLLEAKADPNHMGRINNPLSTQSNNVYSLRILLEFKADPNSVLDANMRYTQRNLKCLLRHGLDPNRRNRYGKTLLEIIKELPYSSQRKEGLISILNEHANSL